MRPIRLEIEGLRSFRVAQSIDFTGRDYLAVIGDTGAGKSSILEALTFVLYGRTTFSGQGHQELMNSSAQALRVVLRFEVGGDCWEVARTLKRAKTGVVKPGAAVLRLLDADGSPREAVEGVREVNARVSSVLGLDADAFLRTVVLPQGQFSRLLVDDDQTRRAGVLRQIWRTDELTEAGALAVQALAEIAPLRGRVQQALLTEPDSPETHLRDLQGAATELVEVAERARAMKTAAAKAAQDLMRAGERLKLVSWITGSLSEWEPSLASVRAGELSETNHRIATEFDALDKEDQRLGAVLAAIPSDDDGFSLEEVLRFDAALDTIAKHSQSLDEADREVATIQNDLGEADARVQRARTLELGTREELDALTSRRHALLSAGQQAHDELAKSQTALAEAREASSLVRLSAKKLAEARVEAERMAADVARAYEKAEAAASAADAAKAQFEAAARASAAASASHGLLPGDRCPVCERDLPHTWIGPVAPELDHARTEYEQAGHRAEASRIELGRCQDHAAASEDAVTTGKETLEVARRRDDEAASTLAGILGEPANLELSDEVVLARPLGLVEKASAALQDHDVLVGASLERHQSAKEDLTTAVAASQALSREAKRVGERRERSRTDLAEQIAKLPDRLRPDLSDVVAGVACRRATLIERHTELQRRSRERDQTRLETGELACRRQRLEEQRRLEVMAPLERLWAGVLNQMIQVERAVDRLAMERPPLPATSCPSVGELAAAVNKVHAATAQVLETASLAGEEASSEASEARKGLVSLASMLGVSPDDVEVVVDAAAAAAETAILDARASTGEAERFARRMEAIRALVDASDRLEMAYLALSDLSAALKDGAFPKWLTLRRSRRLLVHASRLLSEMTAGRYAFADLADESSQWTVFDSDSGEARSPASLSGGEKFLASLALALGMVEMMGRRGGRLESLFLDEGFGALDRTNLDAAVEALGSVAATGRMVAVITHVRAVAEQVQHVLSITREPTGSKATWLDHTARSTIAQDDLNSHVNLAGLLD